MTARNILVVVFSALTLAACGEMPASRPEASARQSNQAMAQKYICAMHPHIVSERPGQCPICGMDLEQIEPGEEAATATRVDQSAPESKGRILYYRNPMGLPDTSPIPKKDSMGMDYIPVYENEDAGGGSVVTVPAETIQTLGVRIANAEMVDFGRTVRTFGTIADNARLLTEITSRVDGWVDELVVTAVGDEVKKDEVLFRLRSPDLIAAKRDYVTALKSGSSNWAASSATRLKSLGAQEQTIAEIKARRTVDELTPFYAERNGIVSMLNVRKGAFVEAGGAIATIADYGEVWVIASIAEQDLAQITPGTPAMLSFPNAPAASRSAEVDYVYPTIDSKTRTGRVRLVLDNANLALRPGAYADVSFEIGSELRLAVPSEAILRDETGAHVVMAMGEGRFSPAPVRIGLVAGGSTEIVEGLNAGDAIVVSGQFLIDSESNLKESLGKLTAGHAGHAPNEASPSGETPEMRSGTTPPEHQKDDDGSRP